MSKRLALLWLILLGGIFAACTDNDPEAERPTQLVVVTSDPTQVALQRTTEAQNATADPNSTEAALPAVIGRGIVVNGEAALLEGPQLDAAVLSSIPEGSSLEVVAQQVFSSVNLTLYQVIYQNQSGWVSSTQLDYSPLEGIDLATTEADSTEVAAAPTEASSPATEAATEAPAASNTPAPSNTPDPSDTPTLSPTPLPEGFVTPEAYSVNMVEQIFEGGRMLWFEPNRQIWVLVGDEVDPREGSWRCFDDSFLDGDPERDDSLDPETAITESEFANAERQQPIRGFGKVWRDNEDLREALGYALMPETMHATSYEYIPQGEVVDDRYEQEPGEYRIESLMQYTLVLEEDEIKAPCESAGGTWRIE